jgi:hypothetical protein
MFQRQRAHDAAEVHFHGCVSNVDRSGPRIHGPSAYLARKREAASRRMVSAFR